MTPMQLDRFSESINRLNETIQDLWSPDVYPMKELDSAVADLSVKGFKHLPPIQYPHVLMLPRTSVERNGADSVVEMGDLAKGQIGTGKDTSDTQSNLLLFIGLNPSTTTKGGYAATSLAPGTQLTNDDFNGMSRNMRTDLTNHAYFQPIREFRTHLFKYHIDLFALFHTSQTNIDRIIGWACRKGNVALLDFFRGQVDAVHQFVLTVQPAQTAVINAFSRDVIIGRPPLSNGKTDHGMINQHTRYSPSLNWTVHPSRLEHPNYLGYMHSAAMLSGQRAMDKGSRERLEAVSMAVSQRGSV